MREKQKALKITSPLIHGALRVCVMLCIPPVHPERGAGAVFVHLHLPHRVGPAGLAMFKPIYGINEPRLMAGMMVSLLPVMVLYFIFSDRIVQGMTAGAIKG